MPPSFLEEARRRREQLRAQAAEQLVQQLEEEMQLEAATEPVLPAELPAATTVATEVAHLAASKPALFEKVATGDYKVLTIQAKFSSRCLDCGQKIRVGDYVRWSPELRGEAVHADTCTHPFQNSQVLQEVRTQFKQRAPAPVATQAAARSWLKPSLPAPARQDERSRLQQALDDAFCQNTELLERIEDLEVELEDRDATYRARVWAELQPCIAIAHGVWLLVRWVTRAAMSDSEKRFSLLELD